MVKPKTDDREKLIRKLKEATRGYIASRMLSMTSRKSATRLDIALDSCKKNPACIPVLYVGHVPGGFGYKKGTGDQIIDMMLNNINKEKILKFAESQKVMIDAEILSLNVITGIRRNIINRQMCIGFSGSSSSRMRSDVTSPAKDNIDFLVQFVKSIYAQTPRWRSNLTNLEEKINIPAGLKSAMYALTKNAINQDVLKPIKDKLEDLALAHQ
jgi:hypothetical protein